MFSLRRARVDVYHPGMFAATRSATARSQGVVTCGVAVAKQSHPLLETAYRRSKVQRQRLIAESPAQWRHWSLKNSAGPIVAAAIVVALAREQALSNAFSTAMTALQHRMV